MATKSVVSKYRNNEVRNTGAVVGKVAVADLTEAGITATEVIAVPKGAYITRLYINVTTAFAAGTIDIGTAADADKFYNDLDITATGITAGVGIGIKVNDITRVRITPTGITGTTGSIELAAEYIDSECVVGTYVEDGR